MSLAIKYENVEDARLRLLNSVVLYDKKPYYIKTIAPGEDGDILRISAIALPYNKRKEDNGDGIIRNKYISSKHFDIAPFKMGYINLKDGVVYASRLPARQQSQGLTSKSISLTANDGNLVPFDWSTFLGSVDTVEMIAGNYPLFEECLQTIRAGIFSELAFCREFAVVKDTEFEQLMYIYHKCVRIGFLVGDKVQLSKKGTCLKESLLVCGVSTL